MELACPLVVLLVMILHIITSEELLIDSLVNFNSMSTRQELHFDVHFIFIDPWLFELRDYETL